MRAVGLLLSATLAAGLLPLASAPADAAVPGNDEPQGAVVLHLGDRVVQDTSEATTNAQDDALNANCGAPATNATVWYTYSPRVDRKVLLDVSASDYHSGVLVFRGTPTPDSLVTCGPGAVALRARAGKTYTIMVISTDATGGRLVLSLKKPPPPPRVHVSVDMRGVAFRGGAARIHGAYNCKHATFAAVSATLLQRAGRLKIRGESSQEVRCNGRPHHWSARVVSPVGTYARGHALAKVRIDACGLFVCHRDRARRHVHLAWAPRPHRQALVQPSLIQTQRLPRLVHRQRHWPAGY